jgi:hypothetical protein
MLLQLLQIMRLHADLITSKRKLSLKTKQEKRRDFFRTEYRNSKIRVGGMFIQPYERIIDI